MPKSTVVLSITPSQPYWKHCLWSSEAISCFCLKEYNSPSSNHWAITLHNGQCFKKGSEAAVYSFQDKQNCCARSSMLRLTQDQAPIPNCWRQILLSRLHYVPLNHCCIHVNFTLIFKLFYHLRKKLYFKFGPQFDHFESTKSPLIHGCCY